MIQVSLRPNELIANQPNEVALEISNSGSGTCTNVVFKVCLPPSIVLLKGPERIEVPSLRPGGIARHVLNVIPRRPGRWAIFSSNFSYCDSGRSIRVDDAKIELTVTEAAPPPPKPKISVNLQTSELALREWADLQGTVLNEGPVDLQWAGVEISGPLQCRGASKQERAVRAGEKFTFKIAVRMMESGHVPVKLKVAYQDSANRIDAAVVDAAVHVGRGSRDATRVFPSGIPIPPDTKPAPQDRVEQSGKEDRPRERITRILFMSADPSDAVRLRLDEEARIIRDVLQRASGRLYFSGGDETRMGPSAATRSRFALEVRPAIRPRDISGEILDVRPRIVHFSGHGSAQGGICLQNDAGLLHEVDAGTLGELFELVSAHVDCVFLNACYSARQAPQIARSIKYVIGMQKAVSDDAAIAFSVGFYQAVGAGRSIPEAFKFGRLQIRLMNVPEHLTPIFIGD